MANKRPVIGITMYHLPAARHSLTPLDMSSLPLVYIDAVARAGGLPVAIPNNPASIGQLLPVVQGVLIVGGDDLDPSRYTNQPVHQQTHEFSVGRDETELQLARMALKRKLPILGICRGQQVLNVALGGTLHQHLLDDQTTFNHSQYMSDQPDEVVWHDITIESGSRLRKIIGKSTLKVNSDHHQGIDRLGKNLKVAARSTDDGVIEAIEGTKWPFALGLQWHPERITSTNPEQLKFFRTLVREAKQFSAA